MQAERAELLKLRKVNPLEEERRKRKEAIRG